MRRGLFVGVVLCVALTGRGAFGGMVYWTDWTSAVVGASGSAVGVITLGDDSTVGVTYQGEVTGNTQVNGVSNYWRPEGTYLSEVVGNLPGADIIGLSAMATHVLTFDRALVDPVFAVVSVGSGGIAVGYDFDRPFEILSQGSGPWGGGSLTKESGDVLLGREGNGVVQFSGVVTSITWTTTAPEYWHGFTVGATRVPEPGAVLLVGLGAVALRRRLRG